MLRISRALQPFTPSVRPLSRYFTAHIDFGGLKAYVCSCGDALLWLDTARLSPYKKYLEEQKFESNLLGFGIVLSYSLPKDTMTYILSRWVWYFRYKCKIIKTYCFKMQKKIDTYNLWLPLNFPNFRLCGGWWGFQCQWPDQGYNFIFWYVPRYASFCIVSYWNGDFVQLLYLTYK